MRAWWYMVPRSPWIRCRRPPSAPTRRATSRPGPLAATRNASDILLVAGAPAMLRVTGNLTPASGPPLDAEEVRSLVTPLLEPAQLDELQRVKSLDFGFFRDGIGRFRVNVHHQRGT